MAKASSAILSILDSFSGIALGNEVDKMLDRLELYSTESLTRIVLKVPRILA